MKKRQPFLQSQRKNALFLPPLTLLHLNTIVVFEAAFRAKKRQLFQQAKRKEGDQIISPPWHTQLKDQALQITKALYKSRLKEKQEKKGREEKEGKRRERRGEKRKERKTKKERKRSLHSIR